MKEAIKHYLLLSAEEKKELWENAIFVFDTNTLLNLYRYTEETKNSFLSLISGLKERVWIPNHVAVEFARNRYSIIRDNKEKYGENNKLQKNKKALIDEAKAYFRGCTNIDELEKNINKWIDGQKEIYKPVVSYDNDYICNTLLTIFDGKVGAPLTDEELSAVQKEGEKRYESKIPPGYCDDDKDGSNKNGDLIIWKEIMRFSKDNDRNIIFITDDKKEDWFYIVKGETIGPRPELSVEFEKETGHSFYLYTMEQFLEFNNKATKNALRQSVIDEIRSIRIEDDNMEQFENNLSKLKDSYFNWLSSEIEQNKKIDLSDIERIIAFYLTQRDHSSQSLTDEDLELLNYLSGYTNAYYISSTLFNEIENKATLEKILTNQNLINKIIEVLRNNQNDKDN